MSNNKYIHPLKIGDVILENNVILAPMAGITDLPFRMICKKMGVGLVCTEMASSKAIFYRDTKTKLLLNTEGEKRPISVQIFGSDVEALKCATKYVNEFADIIDINMGCPAPKVTKNGDGSRLLLNLELIEEIVTEVVKVAKRPVTVKIRKGWDNDHVVAVEVAKIIEKAGAAAITVHGRTREEYYSGKADLDIIKRVKEAVSIPVIGNGDINDVESARYMLEYTGVDGIMIGRAALGNPWIFEDIVNGLKGKEIRKISNNEKLELILEHINLEIKEKGEDVGIKEMRKHLSAYLKNTKDASVIRDKVNHINKYDELVECLKEYFDKLENKY